MKNKLQVLYEDNHIIVVVKPANVLSQSDATGDLDMLTMVKEYVKEKYQKPGNVYIGLVHRLDRPTSGIMVFARTSKAAMRLSEQIRLHQFEKEYLAVVHGILPEKKGTFCNYLEKRETSTIVTDFKHGKYAELSYEVLQENRSKAISKVHVCLKTGRHHQIRVQFASRGYPLLGDQRYGKDEFSELCLVAFRLSFLHPTTKENLTFEISPDQFASGFSLFEKKEQ